MSERVYKMTRLGPGDYLLPSNDAQTLWRLRTYEEEWDDRTVDGWAIWRWTGGRENRRFEVFPNVDEIAQALTDDDWTVWEFWAGPFLTRTAALESVLR